MKSLLLMMAAGTALFATTRPDSEACAEACLDTTEACCAPTALSTSNAPSAPVFTRRGINDETVGSIMGMAMWEGDRPAAKPDLTIGSKESEGCDHDGHVVDTADRSLMISDKGGVANVVFMLEAKGVEVDIPAEPIAFDQVNCRFEPHVIVIPKGATLRFDNSDPVNHNIHTYSKKNQAVNKNVSGGTNFDQMMGSDESFEVKCDIHPWMKGYVVVTEDTHWAVSGPDGTFSMENVPAGDYKLSWWHENLGKGKTESVTVTAGGKVELMHKLGAAGKSSKGRRRR